MVNCVRSADEREIQREQQRSERQQRSGPDPRVRMLAGRRHDSSHQQPPVAQDQFRRQQLGSDKQILMAFYQNVEPAFATDERVQKIIARSIEQARVSQICMIVSDCSYL
eukprot:SAG31_NODE_1617_length_7733_cov_6.446817_6_plen_110_part_00